MGACAAALCFEKGRGVARDAARAAALRARAAQGIATLFARGKSCLLEATRPCASTIDSVQYGKIAVRYLSWIAWGQPDADALIASLADRRDVVSKCCLGCGATRRLKTCNKCHVARFCDVECTARAWPAHKPVCRKWRAEAAIVITP
jgi:hypothetical protein